MAEAELDVDSLISRLLEGKAQVSEVTSFSDTLTKVAPITGEARSNIYIRKINNKQWLILPYRTVR